MIGIFSVPAVLWIAFLVFKLRSALGVHGFGDILFLFLIAVFLTWPILLVMGPVLLTAAIDGRRQNIPEAFLWALSVFVVGVEYFFLANVNFS
jgi:hypothetical protein